MRGILGAYILGALLLGCDDPAVGCVDAGCPVGTECYLVGPGSRTGCRIPCSNDSECPSGKGCSVYVGSAECPLCTVVYTVCE
jgi:hypothetical protein